MTPLAIFSDTATEPERTVTDFPKIVETLAEVGVLLARRRADQFIDSTTPNDVVMDIYRKSVGRMKQRHGHGYQRVDIVSLRPDHPKKLELRQKFLDEHRHADFEVRFFVDGRRPFFLHLDDRVYAILCTQGDLISMPANTPHWFDMGKTQPTGASECPRPQKAGSPSLAEVPLLGAFLGSTNVWSVTYVPGERHRHRRNHLLPQLCQGRAVSLFTTAHGRMCPAPW